MGRRMQKGAEGACQTTRPVENGVEGTFFWNNETATVAPNIVGWLITKWEIFFTKIHGGVHTQKCHKADRACATGQTGVPGQSDRLGLVADLATTAPVWSMDPESE
jgi:hypothetical protein